MHLGFRDTSTISTQLHFLLFEYIRQRFTDTFSRNMDFEAPFIIYGFRLVASMGAFWWI